MDRDLRRHFGDFGGRVWLNCSHQGPLPRCAADAAAEAVTWKTSPYLLTQARFDEVPARLKRALGRLVGAATEDVILTNGASYGLHLLSNGIPLRSGDQVLLMGGDFPSNILPWLDHRRRGVDVKLIRPRRFVPSPDEVAAALRPSARVLCMSWVHSFSGHTADIEAIGALCRERGVWFLVNVTQGVGARPLDARALPVDALVCSGWKWLCGPYATGFAWLRPELRDRLEYNQAYWLAMQTAADLGGTDGELDPPDDLGARKYDIFGTANFLNFHPWAEAVELILGIGIDRIEGHDQALVTRFVDGLDLDRFELLSPARGPRRSTLVFVSHRDAARNEAIYRALVKGGIHIALRRGRLRFSPHFYNTAEDIDRALSALRRAAGDGNPTAK
jgi:selenocysteine lyase/cysteine desulfurase